MTVYSGTGRDGNAGISCWQPTTTVDIVPQIALNSSGSTAIFSTVILPTGTLLVHPGPSTDTIVTWTAPATGSYDIAGFFELLDDAPTGIIASVFSGPNQLYTTGPLTGPAANQSTLTVGGKDTFSLTSSLTAGQILSCGVNNDGDFLNDSSGFDATITAAGSPVTTPEPGSVFLMTAGMVGLGAMRAGTRAGTLRLAKNSFAIHRRV